MGKRDVTITKVTKIKDGEYLINENVKITNIKADENGVSCTTSFTENVTEEEASALSDLFIKEALKIEE